MDRELKNKVIVITGGLEGIGYEIASSFLKKNAKTVIILDINVAKSAKAVSNLNSTHGEEKATFIKCDVTKDLEEVSKYIFETYKQVDVLVNNAGTVDESSARRTLELNTIALVEWSMKFWEHMRKDKGGNGGTIINIGSIYSFAIDPYMVIYKASKFAVRGFSKSLGHEDNYKKFGVRVLVIYAGFTHSSLTQKQLCWDEQLVDFEEFKKIQLWQDAEEVGKAAVTAFQDVQNASLKVYVIDLTDAGSNEELIELRKLLKLFKDNEAKSKEVKLDREEISSDENECFMGLSTEERLRCLDRGKTVGRESLFYPGYYHEIYDPRSKRTIYSLYNYFGGLIKSNAPFTDLTRQAFSQDYLDVGDLSRFERCRHPDCLNSDYMLNLWRGTDPRAMRRNFKGLVEKRATSSDSSDSDSSDSDSSDLDRSVKKSKKSKRNRFQVVFNGDSSFESEEKRDKVKPKKSYSSESVEYQRKEDSSDSEEVPVMPQKSREKYAYLQGNKVFDRFRRRLPHFLPKRIHWTDDDIHHLGYYWFDGPRGRS